MATRQTKTGATPSGKTARTTSSRIPAAMAAIAAAIPAPKHPSPAAVPSTGAVPPPPGGNTSPFANISGGRTMTRILLIDLSQRELQELEALQRTAATTGGLTGEQDAELKDIQKQLASDAPVDKFYQRVASLVARET